MLGSWISCRIQSKSSFSETEKQTCYLYSVSMKSKQLKGLNAFICRIHGDSYWSIRSVHKYSALAVTSNMSLYSLSHPWEYSCHNQENIVKRSELNRRHRFLKLLPHVRTEASCHMLQGQDSLYCRNIASPAEPKHLDPVSFEDILITVYLQIRWVKTLQIYLSFVYGAVESPPKYGTVFFIDKSQVTFH